MIPPAEYVTAADPDEHLNVVTMAGGLHAALAMGDRVTVEAEVLDGTVTGRLLVGVPFMRSRYLLTLERLPDPELEE